MGAKQSFGVSLKLEQQVIGDGLLIVYRAVELVVYYCLIVLAITIIVARCLGL